MKITSHWFLYAWMLICLALPGQFEGLLAAPQERSTDIPGSVWQESENGWSGVWTRRGTDNIFDAVWTLGGQQVTAVLTMTRTGADTVSVYRQDTSQSAEVDYTGTIGRDGSVTGTAMVRGSGATYSWTARIQGWTNRPVADTLGSVWHESENGWSGVWTRRGKDNIFDAVWTLGGQQVTAVLTMTRTGEETVSVYRRDTSQSAEVDYTGTISRDGSVSGTAKVRGSGTTYSWTATIR